MDKQRKGGGGGQRMSVRNSTIFEEVQPLNRMSVVRPMPPQPPPINHKKHSCTDVHCLLIFVCFVVAWCYIAHYAWSTGDLKNVLIPADSKNRKCGVDSGVRNKPYLFFFDLDKCLDPLTPLTGCKTKQVCVHKCPDETFFWGAQKLNDQDLEKVKNLLICDDDVDKNILNTPEAIESVISQGRCSGWYLESEPFFKYCVPFSKVDFCQLVPDSFTGRRRRSLMDPQKDDGEHRHGEPSALSVGEITDSFVSFYNRTTSLCRKNQTTTALVAKDKLQANNSGFTKIIATIITKFTNVNAEKMAEDIKEDLKMSWKVILLAFVIHLLVVLLFITLLRWVATPLVWLSICGVIISLALIFYHSVKQYRLWRANPAAPQHDINLMAHVQNVIRNYHFWLYLAVVTGAALLIILLIVIFIRKRISIAIAIIKEASKAITSIKSSIFFPIFPGILYIIVAVLATLIVLYLGSIGELSFRVFKELDNTTMVSEEKCTCTGPAESYRLEGKCNPEIFETNCHIALTHKPCVETVCRFVEIEKTRKTQMFIYFSVFAYLWVTFFISAYGDMVLACTFSMWYWTFDKKNLSTLPLLKAIGITTLYHLGTLAFGSLILSICRMIRYVLLAIEKKAKMYNNSLTRAILCCMKCFFWLLENFLRFLNRNAYITCAIHSTSFCASSRKAFSLITQNMVRMYAVDKVSVFLFFLSKLLLTLCTSIATYLFLVMYPNVIVVKYPLVLIFLVAILAYVMADVIFGTYGMAVDTLFFCFLEDSTENDGSAEKPYYMSKELCKLLGKKKALKKAKQIRNDFILNH